MNNNFSNIFYHIYKTEKEILSGNSYPTNNYGHPENIVNIISQRLSISTKIVSKCISYSNYLKEDTIEKLYNNNVSEFFFKSIAPKKILLTKTLMINKKSQQQIKNEISIFVELNFEIFNQGTLEKGKFPTNFPSEDLLYVEKLLFDKDEPNHQYTPRFKNTLNPDQENLVIDYILKIIHAKINNISNHNKSFNERFKLLNEMIISIIKFLGKVEIDG
jgi:hypothetical protein